MNSDSQDLETAEHRVAFDFEVDFSNGGGIQGQGFRLDIDGTDITDRDLADYIVADMRLLMVGAVRILNKRVFREPHKRAAIAVANRTEERQGRISSGRKIDLTHTIRNGQVAYPGLPAPRIDAHLSHSDTQGRYAEGVTFHIGHVDMVSNSGTSLDAPFHRYPDGDDLSALAIDRIAGLDAIVVRLTGMRDRAITPHALAPALQDVAGKAVLIDTGRAAAWPHPEYFVDHSYLTTDAAELLCELATALVGIDSMNIDDTSDPARPAHSKLLAAGIPIVENLAGLGDLPLSGFRFSAAPLRIEGLGAFPIRAWAEIAA